MKNHIEYDAGDEARLHETQVQTELLMKRQQAAQKHHNDWVGLWDECYDYALPQRGGFYTKQQAGKPRTDRIFDATALDAAERLAASLMGQLTPVWSQWFGLKPGPDLTREEADRLAPVLEKASETLQAHFDRSNFAVEIHQCFLDLVVGGTAAIAFEENEPGQFSAFRFSAVPLKSVALEEGASGYLDGSFRTIPMTLAALHERYPDAQIPSNVIKLASQDPQNTFDVMEAVVPDGLNYAYAAVLIEDESQPILLDSGAFNQSPILAFRWMKSPGEIYGRSPVMKALPDIKTANKVVELILKNASIAVTGIWQADDDGVLNPANIELSPGSIIPKAIGSRGLQPLEMPGRFDVSQLVLESLQNRIRHALLADKLAPISSPRMTATEVIERSAEMSLLLGATYGRLQAELLTPLIKRAFEILRRRGDVPDIALDGRLVAVDFRSPLARAQGQRNIQNTLSWLNTVLSMGTEGAMSVDINAAARFLADALAVPSHLVRNAPYAGLIHDEITENQTKGE